MNSDAKSPDLGQVLTLLKKYEEFLYFRILTGKKHRQIKLQRLQKVQMLAFGLMVHQINSL